MAYGVEGYSGLGQEAQFDVQRRLRALLDGACARAGLSQGEYEMQPQGDGGLARLPTGGKVDEPRLTETGRPGTRCRTRS
ncbi:hypothetical protein ACGFWD_12475 [Streptomyces sp. NPDC048448]|uniref:hypothetical protein n=1 Tax=unclassified Streptomyces TaxID=2593676 RepID=UPI0034466F79